MSGVVNERAREDRVARAGKTAPTAKMKGRLVLDAALCVLLVFAMLRPVTGQVVHEIAGALLLVRMLRPAGALLRGPRAMRGKRRGRSVHRGCSR